MHQPVVSVIAVGPNETVPEGIAWESVHLPSFDTDEVRVWLAEHTTGTVFVVPATEIASRGTAALAVPVTQDEYLALIQALPR